MKGFSAEQRAGLRAALIVVTFGLLLYFGLKNFAQFTAFTGRVFTILQPIIYGLLLAYLISPVCDRFERFFLSRLTRCGTARAEKWARLLAVSLSVVLLILAFLTIVMLIIPQFIGSIFNFIENYSSEIAQSEAFIESALSGKSQLSQQAARTWSETAAYIETFITTKILPNLNTYMARFSVQVFHLARSFVNFLIGFIVAFYCLDRRRIFAMQAKKILFATLPAERAQSLIDWCAQTNTIFLGFIVGKLIDSAIIGAICFVGVVLMKIQNPVLIAVIIGVTNVIPFFGPFVGAIPCLVLILLENPLKSLYFLIFIVLLQQFDANILGPRILGNSTGIPSFWVLFSILLFGGLWGAPGMIIAVPLFAVVYNLVKELTDKALIKKGLPTAAWRYETPARAEDPAPPESEQ